MVPFYFIEALTLLFNKSMEQGFFLQSLKRPNQYNQKCRTKPISNRNQRYITLHSNHVITAELWTLLPQVMHTPPSLQTPWYNHINSHAAVALAIQHIRYFTDFVYVTITLMKQLNKIMKLRKRETKTSRTNVYLRDTRTPLFLDQHTRRLLPQQKLSMA